MSRNLATTRLAIRNFTHALDFDGVNDVVRIPDSESLSPTSAMTAMVWVKGASQAGKLLSSYDTGAGQRSFRINPNTNKLEILLSDDGTWNAGHTKQYSSSVVAFDNLWHLVGFTFDGSLANINRLKLFVDGVEDTSLTKDNDDDITTLYNSTADIVIGCYLNNNTPTGFFKGKITKLIIYNKALTASEILKMYQDDIIPSGAVAEYFNNPDTDGAGSVLTDSAESNNGTITGAGWTTDTPFKPRVAQRDMKASLLFDGDAGIIEIPNLGIFDGTEEFTISVIIKANTLDNQRRVFYALGENNLIMTFGDAKPNNVISIRLEQAGSWNNPVWSSVIEENKYVEITVSYSPVSGWKLYKDAELERTSAQIGAIGSTSWQSKIGGDGIANQSIKGLFSLCKIWNAVLTPTQIQKMHYDNIIPTGAVLDLDFDTGAGDTIPDLSGNGNDGTITGATWVTDSPHKPRVLASGRVLIT